MEMKEALVELVRRTATSLPRDVEEALRKGQEDEELNRLEVEKQELSEKKERILVKAREVLKKLEVIEDG